MALSDKQEKITLNKLASVRRIEDEFTRRLDTTFKRLGRQLDDYLKNSQPLAAVDVALSRANLEQILIQSGYYETTGALLNDGYQSAIEQAYEQYQELYQESLQFSQVSLRQLDAIKQLDLSQFNQIGQQALTEANRLVVDLHFGGLNFNQALGQLREKVVDKMQRYASTWLTTGLSSAYNTANVQLAEDAGIERFQYIGPMDNLTRSFCRKHIGQVMTLKEWDSLPGGNGQIEPVSVYRGGYNCRHQLIGVVDAK
jgi:hypothetical protein